MALVTRVLNNTGAPLCAPDGTILSGAVITFTLVRRNRTPVDIWDATTNERVSGVETAVVDENGEFSVNLWPNDRGDRTSYYLCQVSHDDATFRPFIGQVLEDAAALSWVDFYTAGTPLDVAEVSLFQQHIASTTEHGMTADEVAAIDGANSPSAANPFATIADVGGGGGVAIWGGITGTLSNQADLKAALDAKSDSGHTHTEADITDLGIYEPADPDIQTHINSAHAPADADNTAANETSHADVVVDGDFLTEGLIRRGATAGVYSVITDNSANWDDAYTHSQSAHAPADADNTSASLTKADVEAVLTGVINTHSHAGGAGVDWGGIGGTLSDQVDLQAALDAKSDSSHNHDGTYAAASHNHDGTYAAASHNHDGTYAPDSHTHTEADITDLGTYEPADATILKQSDVDDTPVNGVTTAPVSSNWAYDHANASNPHSITKSTVGLGNVDNTSDLNKPVSTATQAALDLKADSADFNVQNGFENTTDSTISFTAGTRTFSITPAVTSFNFWAGGQMYTKSSAQNVVISDTEGLHYIYFNTSGSLVSDTALNLTNILYTGALVAVIYWDADNNEAVILADERHGRRMSDDTHAYLHETQHCAWVSGLGLGNILADENGDLNTHAQCSVADGVIRDEDIRHEITDGSPQELSPVAAIPLLYRSGASGNWRKIAATNFPLTTTGTGRAAWNEDTGLTWQLTEVTNNDYILMHLIAVPDTRHPIMGIVGQNEYATSADAEAGADQELLQLYYGGLESFVPEFKPIATLIIQSGSTYANAVKSRIISTSVGGDYVDWRVAGFRGTGGVATGGGTVPAGGTANQVLTKNSSTDYDTIWADPGAGSDDAAIHDNVAGEIAALTEKTVPVDGDLLIIEDSEDSDSKKKIQVGNLLAQVTGLSWTVIQ